MKYRFSVTKDYQLEANSYEEAVNKINSEQEYNYVVNEEWILLEGELSA
jgi:hypothetical protein